MSLRIDVYHHFEVDETVIKKLDKILGILGNIQRKEEAMSKELDDLTAQVEANASVENSAVLLIQGIAAQLAAAKDDPAKIEALAANLKASADNLAAAITANTPVPV